MYLYKLTLILMVIVCSAAFGSERMAIDLFEYAQNSEAREAWKPQADSPPVELTAHATSQGESALLLKCDFSRAEERCYWDKEVALDLTKFGRFSIWFHAENPGAIRNGTLYLQSGAGWFSGWIPVESAGWQQAVLWKSDFRVEESPAGWGKIEKIRLSFWKSDDTDTVVAVDDLEATADEITVVLGDLTTSSEARAVQEYCASMADMLKELGLNFGVVSDTDVESGALSGSKLAIFPYNPDISEAECEAVERFVKSGGKFMLFYSLPERLAKLLGMENSRGMHPEYPGQFSAIGLDAHTAEGLPKTIAQGSWNARIPKIGDFGAEVIGKWVDAEGKNTKIPAITLHQNGIFMGHVLLPGDKLNKKRMLLALFGKLLPDMRPSLAEAALQGVGRIAGFEGFDQASRFIKDNAQKPEALNYLAATEKLLSQAQGKTYAETLDIAREAMGQFQEAYFRSFPSNKNEFRALWCHSAFGIPGWDWDKAIKNLKDNGFNAIIPNMLWGGVAYYPSQTLPIAEEIKEQGDQIALCLEACRKHGVQIHVWKVNWNLSRAPEKFVERIRKEGRTQKDAQGNEVKWLCPSDPRNFKLELDSMLEVVRKYDVDGIHFDYIRYPNRNSCYCAECRKRFEKSKGLKVKNWPQEVITGKLSEDFTQWRCDQITRLVKAVSEQAHKINPKVKISAAVFRDYPRCRETVAQDWKAWIESGYLDFVCPMDYTAHNGQLRNVVANQLSIVKNSIPVYPGIGASAPGLSPEQVARQIHIARKLGISGFVIFNYDLPVATEVLPALSKGLTSSP